MANRYRVLSQVGEATYGEGEVELDLSPAEEKDELDGGHLELIPRTYRILSDRFSGGPQDSEYTAALRVDIERALILGGHIERLDTVPVAVVEPGPEPAATGTVTASTKKKG